jgi:hypothetical protein
MSATIFIVLGFVSVFASAAQATITIKTAEVQNGVAVVQGARQYRTRIYFGKTQK